MVIFSSSISPLTFTVIFWLRSPLAIAVATWAMSRTWLVSDEAMKFTLSVRSFHVPATFGTSAWPPSTPSVPTSRATPVTCSANVRSGSVMSVIVPARAARAPAPPGPPPPARAAGHLLGERAQRVRHVVDRLGERRHLALGLDGHLLCE